MLQRPVTDDERHHFAVDGVVHLPGILDAARVLEMADAVVDTLASDANTDMSAFADVLADSMGAQPLRGGHEVGTGRFHSGVDSWLLDERFARFATASPLPQIVGELFSTDAVYLYEDSVLVKEPGTAERTAFHQDLSYFHLEGDAIATTWTPLDRVTLDSGAVQYVRGSHRERPLYRPNFFVTDEPIPDTEGDVVPSIDPSSPNVVAFDTVPGDVVVHHARTLHGAPANSSDRMRRAISVRYFGAGTRFKARRGAPSKPHHQDLVEGEMMVHHEAHPLVWTS